MLMQEKLEEKGKKQKMMISRVRAYSGPVGVRCPGASNHDTSHVQNLTSHLPEAKPRVEGADSD
jgi:hypothetical protein